MLKKIKFLIEIIHDKYNDIAYSEMLFVTVEPKHGYKGGSDEIGSGIHRKYIGRIDKTQIVKVISKLEDKYVEDMKAVVFVDDIVGTGVTAFNNIKYFLERFPMCVCPEVKIILAPILLTRRGKKFIQKKSKELKLEIDIIYTDILKSAFTGDYIFDNKTADEKEKIVEKYEEIIDQHQKEEGKTYVLGFDKCKLLASTYYDTPNNTLCSFWKVTDAHEPIFERQGQKKRVRIDSLQAKKRSNGNQAYLLATMRAQAEKAVENGIDFLDEAILSYVKKKADIDYLILSRYFDAPKLIIAERVQRLIDEAFLVSENEKLFLTESAKELLQFTWSDIEDILNSEQTETVNFTWQENFIPQNFKAE